MVSIQQHDADALKILVQRYRKLLKCVILRTVQDDASAEDVLQDCLLDLWRNAGHYAPEKGKPLSWLVTLCRRRAIDSLRRTMAYCRAKDRLEVSMTQPEFYMHDSSLECAQADIGRVLAQHLSLLPPPQQEVVRLAFINGMTQREVAQATNSPLGTVKTRMELGLKKLRASFRNRSAIHTLQAA